MVMMISICHHLLAKDLREMNRSINNNNNNNNNNKTQSLLLVVSQLQWSLLLTSRWWQLVTWMSSNSCKPWRPTERAFHTMLSLSKECVLSSHRNYLLDTSNMVCTQCLLTASLQSYRGSMTSPMKLLLVCLLLRLSSAAPAGIV